MRRVGANRDLLNGHGERLDIGAQTTTLHHGSEHLCGIGARSVVEEHRPLMSTRDSHQQIAAGGQRDAGDLERRRDEDRGWLIGPRTRQAGTLSATAESDTVARWTNSNRAVPVDSTWYTPRV